MKIPQFVGRLSAELLDQHLAHMLVCGQRLRLATALIERQHQQGMQVLAQRTAAISGRFPTCFLSGLLSSIRCADSMSTAPSVAVIYPRRDRCSGEQF